MVIEKTPTEYIIRIPASSDINAVKEFLANLNAQQKSKDRPSTIPKMEAKLLVKINEGIPLALLERSAALHEKRRNGKLTNQENDELIELNTQIEQHHLERMKHLIKLSIMRNVKLDVLMQQLGISPFPTYGNQG